VIKSNHVVNLSEGFLMNDFMSVITTLGVGFLIYKFFQMSDEKNKSQKREVELLTSFCESGDAKSCTELANLY